LYLINQDFGLDLLCLDSKLAGKFKSFTYYFCSWTNNFRTLQFSDYVKSSDRMKLKRADFRYLKMIISVDHFAGFCQYIANTLLLAFNTLFDTILHAHFQTLDFVLYTSF